MPECYQGAPGQAPERMAVITRSGLAARDNFFATLRDGLLQQDYAHIDHLIASQNLGCQYLPPWREETPSTCAVRTHMVQSRTALSSLQMHAWRKTAGQATARGKGPSWCPYNKFLHDLMWKINASSWIMILDDDALLTNPQHVSNVMRQAERVPKNTILLQPSHVGPDKESKIFGRQTTWPLTWNNSIYQNLRIDMSNMVFHKSMSKHILLSSRCGADKQIFLQLLQAGGVPRVLNAGETGGVNVWGNSRGASKGGTELGLYWRDLGGQRPTTGIEVVNAKLSFVITNATADASFVGGVATLTADRLKFTRAKPQRSDFVLAGRHYFQVMPVATGCTQHDQWGGVEKNKTAMT